MGWSFLVSHKPDLQGITIFLFYLLEATTTLFRNFTSPSFPSCQGFSNLIAKEVYQLPKTDVNNLIYQRFSFSFNLVLKN
jgi:hypothetical protein